MADPTERESDVLFMERVIERGERLSDLGWHNARVSWRRLHRSLIDAEKRIAELQAQIAALQAAPQAEPVASTYGNCPRCGSPGVARERRPNGNDKCSKGHTYPSREAVKAAPQPQADALKDALSSLDFYKRRCELLQECQKHMRDGERTLVCDILANGQLMGPPDGPRYAPQPQAALITNPYTGTPRDYRDVESDPAGVLIQEPGAPLRAAPQPQASLNEPFGTAEQLPQASAEDVAMVEAALMRGYRNDEEVDAWMRVRASLGVVK
jgi:hypothetical protein